jgi:flagellar protein FliS
MTAPPEQLHLMLLDGAIRFAARGLEAIQARDIEGAYNALERTQQIVVQMMNGLNRDVNPPLVDQMSALYNFIHRRLVEASMERDPQGVEDALRILRHQRETWQMLIDKLAADAPPVTAAAPPSAPSAALRPTYTVTPPAGGGESVISLQG